jgi:hypothetical protein
VDSATERRDSAPLVRFQPRNPLSLRLPHRLELLSDTCGFRSPIIADPPLGATISTLFDASAGLGIAPEGLAFPEIDQRTRSETACRT